MINMHFLDAVSMVTKLVPCYAISQFLNGFLLCSLRVLLKLLSMPLSTICTGETRSLHNVVRLWDARVYLRAWHGQGKRRQTTPKFGLGENILSKHQKGFLGYAELFLFRKKNKNKQATWLGFPTLARGTYPEGESIHDSECWLPLDFQMVECKKISLLFSLRFHSVRGFVTSNGHWKLDQIFLTAARMMTTQSNSIKNPYTVTAQADLKLQFVYNYFSLNYLKIV